MTIAELGALGEFIGSIAVLLTLVYLALQIRHSKELLERHEKISLSQIYQARVDSRRELEKLVIEESMAKIFLKSRPFSSEETEEVTELEAASQAASFFMDGLVGQYHLPGIARSSGHERPGNKRTAVRDAAEGVGVI